MRHSVHTLEEVFNWFDESVEFKDFNGLKTVSNLLNYSLFKEKGTACCNSKNCEVTGTYFALERTSGPIKNIYNNWHFNLYGKRSNGKEVLITKDHVKPKSKGGSDDMSNLQTMCYRCNTKKGSMHIEEFRAIQQNVDFNWSIDNELHIKKRMNERYGININTDEYKKICRLTKMKSTMVHYINGHKTIRKIKFNGIDVYPVYSSTIHSILTVLDPNKIQEEIMKVPDWGTSFSQECLSAFYKAKITFEAEYRDDFEDNKSRAIYFNSCTHPKIMFAKWKEYEEQVHILLWQAVKEQFKHKIINKEHEHIN